MTDKPPWTGADGIRQDWTWHTVGRWSLTLLTGNEDADGNSIRVSMEFDIVELGNGTSLQFGRAVVDGKLRLSMEFDIVELGNHGVTAKS